jgi:CBS domain-containing protein
MVAAGISSLLINPGRGSALGIITKRDVVTKAVAAGRDPFETVVGDLMSTSVRTISAAATLEDCSAQMAEAGVRRLPVSQADEIAGIISDSDILAAVAGHRWMGHRIGPKSAIVADVMRTPNVTLQPLWTESVTPEMSLWDCAMKMGAERELPVVQDGQIIGIVKDTDILRALEERGGPD